jgi:hypothetical protein
MRYRTKRNSKPYPLQVRERYASQRKRLDVIDPFCAAKDLGPLTDELLDNNAEGKRHHGEVRTAHP